MRSSILVLLLGGAVLGTGVYLYTQTLGAAAKSPYPKAVTSFPPGGTYQISVVLGSTDTAATMIQDFENAGWTNVTQLDPSQAVSALQVLPGAIVLQGTNNGTATGTTQVNTITGVRIA